MLFKADCLLEDDPIWGDASAIEVYDRDFARMIATLEGTLSPADSTEDMGEKREWEVIPAGLFEQASDGRVLGRGAHGIGNI